MAGGLFITLYDVESLKLYLNQGIYGFLMKPVLDGNPSARSRHYQILADYACSREGSDIFFFLNRKIVYGGKIFGNQDAGSFYLNGRTSPLGRTHDAELFWDESLRKKYSATDIPGVFEIGKNGAKKAQPFIFQFCTNELTGKYISSDELYFAIGKYGYPLPSNSIQGMGFCTLTPGEVSILNNLISNSINVIDFSEADEVKKTGEGSLFKRELVSVDDELVNEAQLEFTILASLAPFADFLNDEYVLCRQVPISPFKPSDMDRADICLYSLTNPINNGTIPNIIIELKKNTGNKSAYKQVEHYLRWIKSITSDKEFANVTAYIIAPRITGIWADEVSDEFQKKIKMYSIKNRCFVPLKQRKSKS